MKYENFEQEYKTEIDKLKWAEFARTVVPAFAAPSYRMLNARILSFALAVPALVAVFGFFFYSPGLSSTGQYPTEVAMLEDSNTILVNQINSLDQN